MATVGEPDGVAGGGRVPEVLRYGRVQMMCEKRVVKAIFLGVGTNLGEHTGISLVGWIPPATMSLAETTSFLDAHQLSFTIETSDMSFTTLRIEGSHVRLAFTDGTLDRLYVHRA